MIARIWERHDYTTLTPSAVSDRLAAFAMLPDVREAILGRTRAIVRANYPRLEAWLRTHDDVFTWDRPDAGAIAYAKYDLPIKSLELAERIRTERSVLLVPGDMFGLKKGLRFGFGYDIEHTLKGLSLADEVLAEVAAGVGGRGVEAVAHAAHGRDAIVAELLPQVADVHVDHVRARVVVEPPDAAQQLLPAEHLPGMAEERLGERELPCGELDLRAVDAQPTGAQVEHAVAGLDRGRGGRALAPKTGADAREQLLEAERLRHVVVGAPLEPVHGVVDLVTSGEHHDLDPGSASAELAEHLVAVDPRQADVEDHHVEGVGAELRERLLPRRRDDGREAVRTQALVEERGDTLLVLDDQHVAHADSSGASSG